MLTGDATTSLPFLDHNAPHLAYAGVCSYRERVWVLVKPRRVQIEVKRCAVALVVPSKVVAEVVQSIVIGLWLMLIGHAVA